MTIAKGEPILASDIIAVVNRVTNAETAITAANTAITATNTVVAGKQQNLPVGTILMYDGAGWSDNATLSGWYICDGRNTPYGNTPNLTNLFIRGGGAASGGTGGADSQSITLQIANLPSHNHGATGLTVSGLSFDGTALSAGGHEHATSGTAASNGGHTHKLNVNSRVQIGTDNGESYGILKNQNGTESTSMTLGGAHTHTTSGATDFAGVHTHTVSGTVSGGFISGSTASAGSGTAFSVATVPGYYAVIYIKKMA